MKKQHKMKVMKYCILTIISFFIMAFISNAKAQSTTSDNWKDAPAKLCKRYDYAMEHISEKWVETFADSLIEAGEDDDDDAYQYFGMSLHSQQAFVNKDSVAFCESIAKQLQLAKACKFDALYYKDRSLIVEFLLNTGHTYQAERVAMKLISGARRNNNDEGIYYGTRALSKLYIKVNDYKSALELQKESLEAAKRCKKDKTHISEILADLAKTYSLMGDYTKCLENAKAAVSENPDNAHAHTLIAECCFMNNIKALAETAEKARKCKPKNNEQYRDDMTNVRILTLAANGKTDAALSLCDSLSNKEDALNRRIDILKKCGRWEQAFKTQKKLIAHHDSIIHADTKKGVADMNVKINSLFEEQREGAVERSKQNKTFTVLMSIIAILLFIFIVMRGDKHRRG